ncbi:transposase [Mesorhizobium carmichaelinearum]|uniref:transposase n=1 Tax=Mesorhizobium carmichaelinearum TaxID=1208188 RepID=UPI001FCEA433|nr:transposase [Mesorhizobium carmichaelinearum]
MRWCRGRFSRKPLGKALKRSDGAKGGQPPYDPVMMFKIMVLQALYGLSNDQAEFQIQDRQSFMRFLGLGLGDRVPTPKRSGCSGSISHSRRGGQPVRPFRQAPQQGRLPGDGRAFRRCHHRGGPERAREIQGRRRADVKPFSAKARSARAMTARHDP